MLLLVRALIFTVLVFVAALIAATPLRAQTVAITLDPSVSYQTITGWEALMGLDPAPTQTRDPTALDALHDRIIAEVGINRVRLEVRAGAETRSGGPTAYYSGRIDYNTYKRGYYVTQNDNDDPFDLDPTGFDFTEVDFTVRTALLPLKRRLEARGERLIVNLCYVDFLRQNSVHFDAEEYAELMQALFRHMDKTHGFTPDLIEVILEPDHPRSPPNWTPERIGRAIVATQARLAREGFTPRYVVPSVVNAGNATRYMEGIIRVPGAIEHVAELSYHLYGSKHPTELRKIREMAARTDTQPAMLEWWAEGNTIDTLFNDLLLANSAAWQGNWITNYYRNEGGRLVLKQSDRLRGLIFRNVRLGAVRIEAASGNVERARPVAFRLQSGGIVAAARTTGRYTLEMHGLPAGSAAFSFEGDDGTSFGLRPVTIGADGRVSVSVPGSGVALIATQR